MEGVGRCKVCIGFIESLAVNVWAPLRLGNLRFPRHPFRSINATPASLRRGNRLKPRGRM